MGFNHFIYLELFDFSIKLLYYTYKIQYFLILFFFLITKFLAMTIYTPYFLEFDNRAKKDMEAG